MSVYGWVAVGLLLAAAAWLGLALVGAVREIGALRARVDGLAAGAGGPANASRGELPVGAPVPAWRIASPDGEVVSSSTFEGRRHLVLFADAECRACDDLVPEVVGSASAASIPPVAVVGRGDASSTPVTWRAADVRVRVGTERGDEISSAFGVDVTPTVVVVDEGGSVVARGAVATLDDVRVLIRGAEGVRIVAAGGA